MIVTAAAQPATTPVPAAAVVLPITREDVIAEAVYANRHGLIPHGEMGMVNEELGMHWAQKAEQTRLARAEQIRLARLETEQRLAQTANTPAETTASLTSPPTSTPTGTPPVSATDSLAAFGDDTSSSSQMVQR